MLRARVAELEKSNVNSKESDELKLRELGTLFFSFAHTQKKIE